MSLTASNRMLLTPSAKSIMHRCKVIAIQSEADKSDVIYRLFLFAANPNENKKEKMEHENRQWGLRLWSKTNLIFGEGFQQLNQFRAAENIPRRIPTDSVAH